MITQSHYIIRPIFRRAYKKESQIYYYNFTEWKFETVIAKKQAYPRISCLSPIKVINTNILDNILISYL